MLKIDEFGQQQPRTVRRRLQRSWICSVVTNAAWDARCKDESPSEDSHQKKGQFRYTRQRSARDASQANASERHHKKLQSDTLPEWAPIYGTNSTAISIGLSGCCRQLVDPHASHQAVASNASEMPPTQSMLWPILSHNGKMLLARMLHLHGRYIKVRYVTTDQDQMLHFMWQLANKDWVRI